MKEITIFEHKVYRERAIRLGNIMVIVKEFLNVDAKRWEDIEEKIITKEEFEAIKSLFEEEE